MIYKIITDYNSYHKFIDDVESCRVLKETEKGPLG